MFKYHFSKPRTLLLKRRRQEYIQPYPSFKSNQMENEKGERGGGEEREKERGVYTIGVLFYALTRIN